MMRLRSALQLYQLLTALSDGATGILLLAAPALTLQLMRVSAPSDALPFLRYVGAFVLSTGLACAYGAWLLRGASDGAGLRAVWVLTAITRTLVALSVFAQVAAHALAPGWVPVAAFDAALALLHFAGLAKGWPDRASRG